MRRAASSVSAKSRRGVPRNARHGMPAAFSAEIGSVGDLHTLCRGAFEFEHNDLVGRVGTEQRTGKIERPLRPCRPEPAEVEPVHPDIPFRKAVEAHEAVRLALRGECASEELGELSRAARPVQPVEIVEREAGDVEVHESLIVEHERGNALAVVEVLAVVDASHSVHEDGDLVPLLHAGGDEGVLARELELQTALVHAAECPLLLPVHENVRDVVHSAQGHEPRAVVAGEHRAVKYQPEVLPVLLHGKRHAGTVLLSHGIFVLPKPRALAEAHFADSLQHRFRRQNWRFNALFCAHQLADRVICRGVSAVLVQGCAIVVAGDGGTVAGVEISPRGEAEVGAAVEHVEVESRTSVEECVELLEHALVSARVVLAAEVVEPAAPELRTHLRHPFLHACERVEIAAHVAAEVDGDERAVRTAACHHVGTCPVRCEEHDFRAALFHYIAHGGEIAFVVAVAAVLVLHLQGDDGASLAALQIPYLLHDARDIIAYMGEIDRVARAQTYVLVREQPRGEAAEVPFGADVRTGAQYDVKPQLLRGEDEPADVEPA